MLIIARSGRRLDDYDAPPVGQAAVGGAGRPGERSGAVAHHPELVERREEAVVGAQPRLRLALAVVDGALGDAAALGEDGHVGVLVVVALDDLALAGCEAADGGTADVGDCALV